MHERDLVLRLGTCVPTEGGSKARTRVVKYSEYFEYSTLRGATQLKVKLLRVLTSATQDSVE